MITRIYKKLKKLNSPKINEPIKNWATELRQNVLKGKSPNGQKTHEKMLNIPGHKGNANQNQLRFHLTPVRIASNKNTTKKCWRGCGGKETLMLVRM
jgi:hypothetical protein